MDREKLKVIVQNLECLLESLKSEVYSDIESYKTETEYEQVYPHITDYDEVFYDDDDGYAD